MKIDVFWSIFFTTFENFLRFYLKLTQVFFNFLGANIQPQQTTTSSIGPDELPPPYTSNEDRGLPMVTCRVCSAMIDISWKREQHVVKCNQCNEATVSEIWFSFVYDDLKVPFIPL